MIMCMAVIHFLPSSLPPFLPPSLPLYLSWPPQKYLFVLITPYLAINDLKARPSPQFPHCISSL